MTLRRKRAVAALALLLLIAPWIVGVGLNYRKRLLILQLSSEGVALQLTPLVSQSLLSPFGIAQKDLPVLFWRVEEMTIRDRHLTAEKMRRIVEQANRLGEIRSLVVTPPQLDVHGDVLEPLADLDDLESLDVSSFRLKNDELAIIGRFSDLESLSLDNNTDVSAVMLSHLQNLQKLEHLSLVNTMIYSRRDIPVLKSLRAVQSLRVGPKQLWNIDDFEDMQDAMPSHHIEVVSIGLLNL